MSPARVARLAGAVALLVGGLVHLQLYFLGYRSFPDANLGRSFILNAVVSGAVAAALFVRHEWQVRVAGIVVAAGSLAAFVLSRRSDVVFGFREEGLRPSPQAAVALVAELLALGLLLLTFLPRLADRRDRMPSDSRRPPAVLLAVATTATTVLVIALGAVWASSYARPSRAADAPATTVGPAAPATTAAAVDAEPATTTSTTTTEPATSTPEGPTTTARPGAASENPATTVRTTPASTAPPAPTTAPPAPETSPAPIEPAPAAGPTVEIVDFEFAPVALTVPVGSTLTWTNVDQFDHSVVASDTSFESDTLANGDTFAHTFDGAGEFVYICGIHPYMEATVTVTG